jgi:hypothetical protein
MREKPVVVRDMVSLRAELMPAILVWCRLEETLASVPASDSGAMLANGQTVRAYRERFQRESQSFRGALALFSAAEKEYMLRNDGSSPFTEF